MQISLTEKTVIVAVVAKGLLRELTGFGSILASTIN